jgi:myxalamid-type polyketide synthase MxaE and MxaD
MAVLPIDWSVFRTARRGRDLPLFRAIPEASPHTEDADAADDMVRQLHDANAIDRRTLLDTLVRSVVGGVIRRPAAQIDARQPFGAVGVDSLMALEIRNRLETALQRALSATLTWNYPTVESLAAHLDALIVPVTLPDAIVDDEAEAVEEMVPAFADIVALSDADALRALRRGR